MRVEIMWGEPQHAFIDVSDDLTNAEIDETARLWVGHKHPDFDSWDWKKVPDA